MSRIRLRNNAESLNLSDEVIDLTGDSPVITSMRFRESRAHDPQRIPRRNSSSTRRQRVRDDSPIPISYDTYPSIERENSSIQVIDPDDVNFIARQLGNEDEFNNSKLNEEYNTTVPCINDTCSGQQVVLSCPICFEPLAAERKPMATTCGHIFCTNCLQKTLKGSRGRTCPKCNTSVKIKSCVRLYF